jgi:hypothetical protein
MQIDDVKRVMELVKFEPLSLNGKDPWGEVRLWQEIDTTVRGLRFVLMVVPHGDAEALENVKTPYHVFTIPEASLLAEEPKYLEDRIQAEYQAFVLNLRRNIPKQSENPEKEDDDGCCP